jgi:hypothetical protein
MPSGDREPVDAANRSGGTDRSFGPVGRGAARLDSSDMKADLRRCRRAACIAGIAAVAALASACGGGGGAASAANDPPLVKYTSAELSFRHSAEWKAYPFRWAGELHFHPLVYLSTQPVHDPCTTHGNETTCGFPVRQLQPGGVLAVWEPVEIPIANFPHGSPGATTRIGGRYAKRVTARPGICRTIGADLTISLGIANQTQFVACLRGPNLAQNERRLDALLASTHFPAS